MNNQNKEILKRALIEANSALRTFSEVADEARQELIDRSSPESNHKYKFQPDGKFILGVNHYMHTLRILQLFEDLNLEEIFDENELPKFLFYIFKEKRFSKTLKHLEMDLKSTDLIWVDFRKNSFKEYYLQSNEPKDFIEDEDLI